MWGCDTCCGDPGGQAGATLQGLGVERGRHPALPWAVGPGRGRGGPGWEGPSGLGAPPSPMVPRSVSLTWDTQPVVATAESPVRGCMSVSPTILSPSPTSPEQLSFPPPQPWGPRSARPRSQRPCSLGTAHSTWADGRAVKAGAGVVSRAAALRPGGGSRRYLCRRPANSRNSSDLARLSPTQTRRPAGTGGAGESRRPWGKPRGPGPELRGPGVQATAGGGCSTCGERQEGRPLDEAPVGVQEVAGVELAGRLPLRLVQEHGVQQGQHGCALRGRQVSGQPLSADGEHGKPCSASVSLRRRPKPHLPRPRGEGEGLGRRGPGPRTLGSR